MGPPGAPPTSSLSVTSRAGGTWTCNAWTRVVFPPSVGFVTLTSRNPGAAPARSVSGTRAVPASRTTTAPSTVLASLGLRSTVMFGANLLPLRLSVTVLPSE